MAPFIRSTQKGQMHRDRKYHRTEVARGWGLRAKRELVFSGSQFLSGMMRKSLKADGSDGYTLWMMYLMIPYSMLKNG